MKSRRLRKWVHDREQRSPRKRRERLKDSEIKEEYERRTEELMSDGVNEERGWKEMTEVMMTAAKEVCDVTKRKVANPWTVGKEKEIETRKEMIKVAVSRRHKRLQEMDERGRLRPKREDATREVELAKMKMEVRNARKNMKGYLRELKQDWCNEGTRECEVPVRKGD